MKCDRNNPLHAWGETKAVLCNQQLAIARLVIRLTHDPHAEADRVAWYGMA